MVLMNVEDYAGAIREAHRVLAPGGAICMSITHPCFSAPVSDWVGGKGTRARHFAVDRYFERIAWEDRIAPTFRTPTLRRHRPLEDYMQRRDRRGIRAAGVSGADGDGGGPAGVAEVRADDARAVLPVHALGEAARLKPRATTRVAQAR